MKSLMIVCLSALAAALGCSTADKNDDVSNSQTHWLHPCESSSECGDLKCSCGVCTTACSDDGPCGENATCVETADLSCQGASESVCLASCDQDEDCGDGGSCENGACVYSGSSSDEPPGVDCEDYTPCSVDNATVCEDPAWCIAAPGCATPICISTDEWCDLSCADQDRCAVGESLPGSPSCPDVVPGDPGSGGSGDDDTADDDVVGDDDTTDDDVVGDDDTADDDVAADDDTADDDVAADDDTADDDVVGDDDTADGGVPLGVDCSAYPTCSVEDASACVDPAWCINAPGCGTALCITSDDWCEQSCPNPNTCSIGDSFPGSPNCADMVPGRPRASDPDAGAAPPGVQCADYPVCDPMGASCGEGENCMALVGCNGPICIPADEACAASCPDPSTCAIAESYPEQLSCPGRVDAHDDASAESFACGTETCNPTEQYCLAIYSGILPDDPSYGCQALPTDCNGMATCECVGYPQELVAAGSCTESDGAVTVTLAAP
jgi:hypothetical protein